MLFSVIDIWRGVRRLINTEPFAIGIFTDRPVSIGYYLISIWISKYLSRVIFESITRHFLLPYCNITIVPDQYLDISAHARISSPTKPSRSIMTSHQLFLTPGCHPVVQATGRFVRCQIVQHDNRHVVCGLHLCWNVQWWSAPVPGQRCRWPTEAHLQVIYRTSAQTYHDTTRVQISRHSNGRNVARRHPASGI